MCQHCVYGLCEIANFTFKLIDFEVRSHYSAAFDNQMFVREEAYVKDLTEIPEFDIDVSVLDELLEVEKSNDSMS